MSPAERSKLLAKDAEIRSQLGVKNLVLGGFPQATKQNDLNATVSVREM